VRGCTTIKNILAIMGNEQVGCWRLGQPVIHSAAIEIDALYFTGNAAYLEALNLFHTG
jgi:hypothetical protein